MAEVTNAQIVKAWETFSGRKGEFAVEKLKDASGLETVGVRNKVSGSLIAEVVVGEEEKLLNCGEPTSVTHTYFEEGQGEIDNKKEVREAMAQAQAPQTQEPEVKE